MSCSENSVFKRCSISEPIIRLISNLLCLFNMLHALIKTEMRFVETICRDPFQLPRIHTDSSTFIQASSEILSELHQTHPEMGRLIKTPQDSQRKFSNCHSRFCKDSFRTGSDSKTHSNFLQTCEDSVKLNTHWSRSKTYWNSVQKCYGVFRTFQDALFSRHFNAATTHNDSFRFPKNLLNLIWLLSDSFRII